ncbi:hypothetical protein PR202_gb17633 [Eleusine coracana subsp. coracana]|uniref:Pectinesterase inhibitor domain-containing protein n=1 Tax=Eleusine coracana subsp. coracana TaxID=191504 RepID=A0AAV5F426_ELECO|nr:hypothetical protein PR202_gb17633 [Eleusine coracana subsp. coracana]
MAGAASPPLLLLLVLLAIASTTQCHGHKRHHTQHHHTKAPMKTTGANMQPPATAHAICHATPHPAPCLAAVDAAATSTKKAMVDTSAVSVNLLPPNILSVALASLNGALSTLTSSVSPALSALSSSSGGGSPWVASLRRGAAQDCLDLHASTLRSLARAASLLASGSDSDDLPAARAHLSAALTNKATCLDGLAGASVPHNVDVPVYKTNIAVVGDGRDVTVVTGSRSRRRMDHLPHRHLRFYMLPTRVLVVAGASEFFRPAATLQTPRVSGEGFLARDITFRNTAGAGAGQAVSGTVDVVFGNAAAVLQGCALLVKPPVQGQFNVVTAQGRNDPNEDTGIVLHNCTLDAAAVPPPPGTRTFLGRPWGPYARAAVLDSYLGPVVDAEGWVAWPGAEAGRGDTVYFGEYGNGGPGADTGARVGWAGVHQMGYDEAAQFAVENFIYGDEWLGATSFPYDTDV